MTEAKKQEQLQEAGQQAEEKQQATEKKAASSSQRSANDEKPAVTKPVDNEHATQAAQSEGSAATSASQEPEKAAEETKETQDTTQQSAMRNERYGTRSRPTTPNRHFSREQEQAERKKRELENWKPKTTLGMQVKEKQITSLDTILESGQRILESEIVDILLPELEVDFVMVGQAKGKFGGGQRRVFKQTQKKTNEGNKPSFSTAVVVGNKKGFVGIGYAKGRETVPAREKALRKAKLNIMKVPLGSGSWEGNPEDTNSIPFRVSGKVGSVKITLIPAPKGTGLRAPSECSRIFSLIGIQDIWTQTLGQTRTTGNLVRATAKALQRLNTMTMNVHEQRGEMA